MASFFSKKLNADQLTELIRKNQENNSKIIKIDNIEINDFIFPFDIIENIHFSNTSWNSINSENKTFKNIVFKDCSFKDVNFRHSKFINVVFKNCTLKNVVFNNSIFENILFEKSKLVSTDSNSENSYRELKADTITFLETELDNINFFDSKAVFRFDKSKLNDVTGMGLMTGSALHFNNSNAFDVDFSSSKLTTLEIKNSTIKRSTANNCTITNILLEDSELDFSIGAGNGYETVTANNTGSVIIGASPVKKVKISGCPKNTRSIMVGGDKFDTIEIENCNADEIIFFESDGNYISVVNSSVYQLDFSLSKINHLKLDNLHIKTKLYYDASNIKKLDATNISFDKNIDHSHEGSNIEIKEDKKPIEAQ